MRYTKADGSLLHPIENPDASLITPSILLWKVRIDDRGDLCVYTFARSSEDAFEAGEDYANREGWEFNDEDLDLYEEAGAVFPAEEGEFVRAIAKLTAVADDHAEYGVDISQDPTDAARFQVLPGDNDEPGQEYPVIASFSAYSWQEALAAVQATGIRVVRVVDVDSDLVWTAPAEEMATAVRDMEPDVDQFGYEPGHPGSPYRVDPPTRREQDALGTYMGWKKAERSGEVVYLLPPALPGRPETMRIGKSYGRYPWEVQKLDVFNGWVTWVEPGTEGATVEGTIRRETPEEAAQALSDTLERAAEVEYDRFRRAAEAAE